MKFELISIPLGQTIEHISADRRLKTLISVLMVNEEVNLLGVSIEVNLWLNKIEVAENEVVNN